MYVLGFNGYQQLQVTDPQSAPYVKIHKTQKRRIGKENEMMVKSLVKSIRYISSFHIKDLQPCLRRLSKTR